MQWVLAALTYNKQAIKPHGSEERWENHEALTFQALCSKTLFDTLTHDSMQLNQSCWILTPSPSTLYYFKKS